MHYVYLGVVIGAVYLAITNGCAVIHGYAGDGEYWTVTCKPHPLHKDQP